MRRGGSAKWAQPFVEQLAVFTVLIVHGFCPGNFTFMCFIPQKLSHLHKDRGRTAHDSIVCNGEALEITSISSNRGTQSYCDASIRQPLHWFKKNRGDLWCLTRGECHFMLRYSENLRASWLCGSVGWSIIPYTKRLWVRSLVRVHAGCSWLMFLSYVNVSRTLFLSPFPTPLSLALKSVNISWGQWAE